jgi:hypothetical protein
MHTRNPKQTRRRLGAPGVAMILAISLGVGLVYAPGRPPPSVGDIIVFKPGEASPYVSDLDCRIPTRPVRLYPQP